MIDFPAGRIVVQSAQSHDWDARATEMIAEARKMPHGQLRSDALGEAGKLRIAAEMDFDLLGPFLRTVEMVQGTVLVAAGDHLTQAYFPHSGVISLVVNLADGQMVEVAMIGRDSVFGSSAALDGQISLTDANVLLPGIASILDVDRLRSVSKQSPALQALLIRHEQALFAKAQQTAACHAAHAFEMRLTRPLLRMHDLSEVSLLTLTQDALAQMIGVKRNSASISAHALQEAGVIKYARGKIQITDLDGLKSLTCECYKAVAVQYNRLLHDD